MTIRLSRWLAAVLALQIGTGVTSAAAPPPAPAPALAAQIARERANYRTFFGLDTPKYDTSEELTRRNEMCDALKSAILDSYRAGELGTDDPTAGAGGTLQHSLAAPLAKFMGTDLGESLKASDPPKDLASKGNYYARITEPAEAELQTAILASSGNLTPADVLRMALAPNRGNYVLATLTAANLLKNVAYLGRDDVRKGFPQLPASENSPGDKPYNVVGLASKLSNLRGNPGEHDLLGPWYHIFSILFVGSITSEAESETMTSGEHTTRVIGSSALVTWLLKVFGKDAYSPIDKEKADWDRCAEQVMAAVHPVLYAEAPSPARARPVYVRPLTVEVLDSAYRPVTGAVVTLYKPVNFPGTAIASASSDAKGNATFSASAVGAARNDGAARIGVKANGYEDAVKDVDSELLSSETPHYLVYLDKAGADWDGKFTDGAHVYTLHYTGSLSGGSTWTQPGQTFNVQGGTETYSDCKIEGTTAHCKMTGEYHDTDKSIDTASDDVTLKLSGDVLTTTRKLTKADVHWKHGDKHYTSAVTVGASFGDTNKRIAGR